MVKSTYRPCISTCWETLPSKFSGDILASNSNSEGDNGKPRILDEEDPDEPSCALSKEVEGSTKN